MSHLPLDARAILHYLNELGYRNISAEQLKEFLKGMQSPLDIGRRRTRTRNDQQHKQQILQIQQQRQQQLPHALPATPNRSTRARTTATEGTPNKQCEKDQNTSLLLNDNSPLNRSGRAKIFKSSKPLKQFKFYLDIEDHHLCSRIEEKIKNYGGSIDFFLSPAITHFITDKNVTQTNGGYTQSLNSNTNLNSHNNNEDDNNNNSTSNQKSWRRNLNNEDSPAKTTRAATGGGGVQSVSSSIKSTLSINTDTAADTANKCNLTPKHTSRADAILKRARRDAPLRNSTPIGHIKRVIEDTQLNNSDRSTTIGTAQPSTTAGIVSNISDYVVWHTDYALKFFAKIQRDLSKYLTFDGSPNDKLLRNTTSKKVSSHSVPLQIKGQFIKLEALNCEHRPYYQVLNSPLEWPKVDLNREDCAFRLSPKRAASEKKVEQRGTDDIMTRKPRVRSSQHQHATVQNLKKANQQNSRTEVKTVKRSTGTQGFLRRIPTNGVDSCKKQIQESSEKQCGICEICKIEYDTLTIHLKTKDHEYFAKNSANYIALDTLIDATASVKDFLNESGTNCDDEEVVTIKEEGQEAQHEEDDKEILDASVVVDKGGNAVNTINSNNLSTHSASDQSNTNLAGINITTAMAPKSNKKKSNVSPILRERSKRSTKGKHSSEKFQNLTSKPPKKNPSPQKAASSRAAVSDLKNSPVSSKSNNSNSKTNGNDDAKTSTGKKDAGSLKSKSNRKRTMPQPSGLTPPKRAMLPPSSMYKVVETNTEPRTTALKERETISGVASNVASPSIIVKFKKLRTELDLLNDEAVSFMYPKRRSTSTDLPTDIDRHSTSDPANNSNSSSTFVSSDVNSPAKAESSTNQQMSTGVAPRSRRAIAIAKRKLTEQPAKGIASAAASIATSTSSQKRSQSFPNAPIQPIEQQKLTKSNKQGIQAQKSNVNNLRSENRSATASITGVAITISNPTNSIILPEATRKSTRTATAIVTAATKSSRLLQAAVEAAKSKSKKQQQQPSTAIERKEIKLEPIDPSEEDCEPEIPKFAKNKRRSAANQLNCGRIPTVVKLEDRMGDMKTRRTERSVVSQKDTRRSKTEIVANVSIKQEYDSGSHVKEEDEEIDFDDDEITIDDDDDKDEDFTLETERKSARSGKRQYNRKASTRLTSRDQRANNRRKRLLHSMKMDIISDEEEKAPVKKTPKKSMAGCASKGSAKRKDSSGRLAVKKNSSKNIRQKERLIKKESMVGGSHVFDYMNSERSQTLQYAFERLPTSDHWYKVFNRQDECKEQYFQYFGSTDYHKLPYELGPIPFESSLWLSESKPINCRLCQKPKVESTQEKSTPTTIGNGNVNSSYNDDTLTEHKVDANVPNNSSVLNSSVTKGNNTANGNPMQIYTHKHKKLHLLQKYRQEQEQLELQRQKLEEQTMNPIITSLKEDSNSNSTSIDMSNEESSRLQRAGSINSNASSYASSGATATGKSTKARNKHLNRAAYLAHLELPPRKSPREHASTLALVSCIIRQRQDSNSKTNSETDEPPTPAISTTPAEKKPPCPMPTNNMPSSSHQRPTETTPTNRTFSAAVVSDVNRRCNNAADEKNQALPPPPAQDKQSNTVCTTPVEEVRFATEISETVKRMRRGRNKYDYSPPFVIRKAGKPRNSDTKREEEENDGKPVQNYEESTIEAMKLVKPEIEEEERSVESLNFVEEKIHPPQASPRTLYRTMECKRNSKTFVGSEVKSDNTGHEVIPPSIRKTGSKKGVVEFEMDTSALEALNGMNKNDKVDAKLLEWQIDKYITMAGIDYDMEPEIFQYEANISSPVDKYPILRGLVTGKDSVKTEMVKDEVDGSKSSSAIDFFSNTIDFCDVLMQQNIREGCVQVDGTIDEQLMEDRKPLEFSLFNASALHNYYRKRKSLNRTGWPRVNKKKTTAKQQLSEDRIYFLNNGLENDNIVSGSSIPPIELENIKVESMSPTLDESEAANSIAEEENAASERPEREENNRVAEMSSVHVQKEIPLESREGNVMTPPDSDIELINAQARLNDCLLNANLDPMMAVRREEKIEADVDPENDTGIEVEDGPLMIDLNGGSCGDGDDDVNMENYRADDGSEMDVEIIISRKDDEDVDVDELTEYYEVESVAEVRTEDEEEDMVSSDDDERNPSIVSAEDDADADIEEEEDDYDDREEDLDDRLSTSIVRNGNILSASPQCLRAFDIKFEPHTECNHTERRIKCSKSLSPVEKLHNGMSKCLRTPNSSSINLAASSTPTKQLMRGSRRTPQLNGSLGSCMSPSEKAGDNSDIFTVSSDGLDTDLDLSNSHSQMKTCCSIGGSGGGGGDTDECLSPHHHHQSVYHGSTHSNHQPNNSSQSIHRNTCSNNHFIHYNNYNSNSNNSNSNNLHHHLKNHLNYYHNHQNHAVANGISSSVAGSSCSTATNTNTTSSFQDGRSGSVPRRRLDLSKYAPTNATTCAAEAATAAVKSMAISQFLKKEVRVTCRRLRAPFRRFRYRR